MRECTVCRHFSYLVRWRFTLVKQVPRRAAAQVRQLVEKLETPRTNRERDPFQKAFTCKNYIAILQRGGWALRELHEHLGTR